MSTSTINVTSDEKLFFDKDGHLEFGPDDPENPQNFAFGRKCNITAIAISLVMNATFSSSAPSVSFRGISEDLDVSEEATGLVTTLFLLGYCFGPLFWAPLSEFYGRRWIFYISFTLYLAFGFLCAFTPTFAGLLVGRFITSTAASAALTNATGILADIWGPFERGDAMILFATMTFVGPALGPVVSGFLQLKETWRWTFYVLLMMAGPTELLLFTLSETLPMIVLRNKARRLRRIPGNENIRAPVEASDRALGGIFKVALTRPWRLLIDPISFFVAIYYAVVYAMLYMLFSIYPIVFQQKRGWNAGVEFAELDALPPSTLFDEYSAKNALVDSMVALAIQHSHATGLSARILGLQQQNTWPGFEYFHRARECMRADKEVTLEVLRCLTLMALYFMKGNACREAYNLLGIPIRKAYIAKLHRLPPTHLSEVEKTARTQLWWVLFSLDLQCSQQLEMPAASQKSLIKCHFPAEHALANYLSPNHREEGAIPCKYSLCLIKLAVVATDISACVSTADLVENDGASLENHALSLSSALEGLEDWRAQLSSELLLSRHNETLDFERDLRLPSWLQRQMVLLELHYHNSYMLIQRPFIRLRDANGDDARRIAALSNPMKSHVELHSSNTLRHAISIVDVAFTVCSLSDILYGWSKVLQLLWNAALTILAYVYANSLGSLVPRSFDAITRAQAIFDSFSATCPIAFSAKDTVKSLADSVQTLIAQGSCGIANSDPMARDLFASLFQEQSTSDDLYSGMSFSPFIPSIEGIDTLNFNPTFNPTVM